MKFFTYILTLPFIYFLALLPFRLMYIFSDFLSFVLYRIIGYRKQVVRANLIRTRNGVTSWVIGPVCRESSRYHQWCNLCLQPHREVGQLEFNRPSVPKDSA